MLMQLPSIQIPHSVVVGEGGESHLFLRCFSESDVRSNLCMHRCSRRAGMCAPTVLQATNLTRVEYTQVRVESLVMRSLSDKINSIRILTDSAITLQWVLSYHLPLSANVRNSVLELRCLTHLDSLFHVRSAAHLAALGNKEAGIEDIAPQAPLFAG